MSCLPTDALSHFEQREQELLAINRDLELKRARALAEASSVAREAAESAENAGSASHVGSEPPSTFVEVPSLGLFGSRPSSIAGVTVAAPEGGVGSRPPSSAGIAQAAAGESLLSAAALPPRPPSSGGHRAGLEGGSEALLTTIKFQNARIVALQEELDRSIKDLSARDAEVQQLQLEGKQAKEEIARLEKVAAGADKTRDGLKSQLVAVEAKVKDLERERNDLLKEKNGFDLQQRRTEADMSAKEARMNRLIEENEKYKSALKDAGSQDRDRAVADRREVERLQGEVRKLERQRSELVNAFKKQMKLIEVLKRQRAHMEAARVLSFTEEEFIRVLELGDKLGE